MRHLATRLATSTINGVNHRFTAKLPGRLRIKIAIRHWTTSAGHQELFIKFHIWRETRQYREAHQWEIIPRGRASNG